MLPLQRGGSFFWRSASSLRLTRSLSTTTYFRRDTKRHQRNVAACLPDSADYEYLRDEAASRLLGRLDDIKREFPVVLDLGCHAGNIVSKWAGQGGFRRVHMLDGSEKMLLRDHAAWSTRTDLEITGVCSDEEAPLPFADATFDLVASSLALHWVNDIPGVLREVLRVLKPDGVFLATILGGETLAELRSSFVLAEQELYGGVSPHVSPMMGIADAGNALQDAGFGLTTVDTDVFAIGYPDARALMRHLKNMGESNACVEMRGGARRALIEAAVAAYHAEHADPEDGSIPATFQLIHMIGWKPAASQPTPLKRGSVPSGFSRRKPSASAGSPDVEGTT